MLTPEEPYLCRICRSAARTSDGRVMRFLRSRGGTRDAGRVGRVRFGVAGQGGSGTAGPDWWTGGLAGQGAADQGEGGVGPPGYDGVQGRELGFGDVEAAGGDGGA